MKIVKPEKPQETKDIMVRGKPGYYQSTGGKALIYEGHEAIPDHFWKYLEVETSVYKIYKSKLGRLFYYS